MVRSSKLPEPDCSTDHRDFLEDFCPECGLEVDSYYLQNVLLDPVHKRVCKLLAETDKTTKEPEKMTDNLDNTLLALQVGNLPDEAPAIEPAPSA